MNKESKKLYKSNIELLKSIEGHNLLSATRELYFYENKLDKDSMGALRLIFENDKSLVFDCYLDSESLLVREGDFTVKTDFEKEVSEFKWVQENFVESNFIKKLSSIKRVTTEFYINDFDVVQIGCKLEFSSEDFLNIWTMSSDNIFYAFNEYPPHHKKNMFVKMDGIIVID